MITDAKAITTCWVHNSKTPISQKQADDVYHHCSVILERLTAQKVVDPVKIFTEEDHQLVLCWTGNGQRVVCSLNIEPEGVFVMWMSNEELFECDPTDTRPSASILAVLQEHFPNPHI